MSPFQDGASSVALEHGIDRRDVLRWYSPEVFPDFRQGVWLLNATVQLTLKVQVVIFQIH